jgi:hypothetical protein
MDEIKTFSQMYDFVCQKGSTFKQHAEAVKKIAQKCSSITELGVQGMNSGIGLLYGLSESPHSLRSYLGIDINFPPENILNKVRKMAEDSGINFTFKQISDLDFSILDPVDFLHIDTSHTYLHLTYELETFAPFVRSYILMHDTSDPYGYRDDSPPKPELDFRYPAHINRKKRGLWIAIEDFLYEHSDWSLYERGLESPGYTIIKRKNSFI